MIFEVKKYNPRYLIILEVIFVIGIISCQKKEMTDNDFMKITKEWYETVMHEMIYDLYHIDILSEDNEKWTMFCFRWNWTFAKV